jgi:hypothetical protein
MVLVLRTWRCMYSVLRTPGSVLHTAYVLGLSWTGAPAAQDRPRHASRKQPALRNHRIDQLLISECSTDTETFFVLSSPRLLLLYSNPRPPSSSPSPSPSHPILSLPPYILPFLAHSYSLYSVPVRLIHHRPPARPHLVNNTRVFRCYPGLPQH